MSNRHSIKFRVWDAQNSRYLEDSVMWSVAKMPEEMMPGQPPWVPFLTVALYAPSEKYVVEALTGLLDKNGKEIYEGDIVKTGGAVYQVLFGPYKDDLSQQVGIGFYLEQADGFFQSLCQKDKFVVLGNTHENPELFRPNVKAQTGGPLK